MCAQGDLLLQTCVSERGTNTAALCAEQTNTNCHVSKTQQKHLNFLAQVEKQRTAFQLL